MLILIKIGRYFRLVVRLDDMSLVDLIQLAIWVSPLIMGLAAYLR